MEQKKIPEEGAEGRSIGQPESTKTSASVTGCPKCKSTNLMPDHSMTNTAAVVGGLSGAALAAGGMAKGAVIGSFLGPVGAALGAVAGLMVGTLSGGAAGATVGGVVDRAKGCVKCQNCGHVFKG